MINIKIFSKHNFLVCGKDFEEELCDFCYVDVFLEDSEKCYLKFFPLFAQATSIPFCICISVNANQIECDANNIKIYQVGSHYEIFVSPFEIKTNNICTSQTFQLAKTNCKINIWENKVEFLTKQHCHTELTQVQQPNFENINSNIIVYGENNQNKVCLLYYPKTNVCKKILCDQIEIDNKKLKVLCNLETCFGHKILQTYCFSETGFEIENCELYQSQNKKNQTSIPETIPYLFLECIKAKDFVHAKTFVENQLKDFSKNTFESYFGEFDNINLLSKSPLTYVIYNQTNASIFEFCIDNNKICDINKI